MMPPHNWTVTFTGTAASGRKRNFEVDLKKHTADVVTPALQDPRRPQCCPLCFEQYTEIITDRANESFFTEILVSGHDFLDACASVLAASRTSDELESLRRLLKDNILQCGTKHWHPYLPRYSKDLLYPLISSLYFCLNAPFYRGPRPLKPGATFARPRKGFWPVSLDDLLPRGPQASLAAHVFWCRTFITPSAVSFMSMILDIARPTVWPLLIADPQRSMLLDGVISLLLFGCETMASAWVEEAGLKPEWSPGEKSSAITFATQMLCTIRDGHDSRDGDARRFFEGQEQTIFETINAVFDSGVALSARNREVLAYIALRLQDELGLPASSLHPDIADVRDNIYYQLIAENPNLAKGARMTHQLIETRSRLRTCAGPGCTAAAATMQAGEPGKLQVCGRCKLTRYCGRGCQQADWKDDRDRAPHKALCPILNKLSASSIESTSLQEFAAVFKRAGLTKEEFAVLVLWARTSQLIPGDLFARFL